MTTVFLNFLKEINKIQSYECIEFRASYTSILHRYMEFQCPKIAEELQHLMESYYILAEKSNDDFEKKG